MSTATALKKFGFKDEFDILSTPEAFSPTSASTTFKVGVRTPFMGTLNGHEVTAYGTLGGATLNRLSLLSQVSPYTNSQYYIVTGTMRAQMDLEIELEGKAVPLVEILTALVNANTTKANQISVNDFVTQSHKIGFPFGQSWTMLWHKMGANLDGYDAAVSKFKELGAVNAMNGIKNPGRIKEAWQIPNSVTPPAITSFEVQRADRSMSKTQQGFTDFIDAVTSNFVRVVELRKEIHALHDDDTAEAERTAKRTASNSWTSNLSGAQERMIPSFDGTLTPTGIWDGTEATVGRISLEEGSIFNFWGSTGNGAVSTTVEEEDEGENDPF